jgi:hypothetical protein
MDDLAMWHTSHQTCTTFEVNKRRHAQACGKKTTHAQDETKKLNCMSCILNICTTRTTKAAAFQRKVCAKTPRKRIRIQLTTLIVLRRSIMVPFSAPGCSYAQSGTHPRHACRQCWWEWSFRTGHLSTVPRAKAQALDNHIFTKLVRIRLPRIWLHILVVDGNNDTKRNKGKHPRHSDPAFVQWQINGVWNFHEYWTKMATEVNHNI